MEDARIFHVVLTTARIRLVRWPGADWQDLQEHFEDFVTAFGPLDEDEVLDLIDAEWPDLGKVHATEIAHFFATGAAHLTL